MENLAIDGEEINYTNSSKCWIIDQNLIIQSNKNGKIQLSDIIPNSIVKEFGQIRLRDYLVVKNFADGQVFRIILIGQIDSMSPEIGIEIISYDIKRFQLEYLDSLSGGKIDWGRSFFEITKVELIKLFISKTKPELFIPKNINLQDKKGIKAALGVEKIATVLISLIKNITNEKGINLIGIFGRWGRGKTFLMEKIWEKIQSEETKNNNVKRKEYIRVDFHPWKYQDTRGAWAYLYEVLVDQYINDKPKFKWIQKLRLSWKRKKMEILGFILSGCISILSILFVREPIAKALISGFGLIVTIQLFLFIKNTLPDAKNIINSLFRKNDFDNFLGLQHEVQKEIKLLLETWFSNESTSNFSKKQRRIILFVDDIDRCKEGQIIQLIDSLRVMLEDEYISSRIIVIAAIDEGILSRAIISKYRNVKNHTSRKRLVKEYLDKLFIFGLKLPKLDSKDKLEILDTILERKGFKKVMTETNSFSLDNLKAKLKFPALETVEKLQMVRKWEEQISEIEKNSENFSEIAGEDYEIIKRAIAALIDSTPRQIRIFYYRYVVAKELLFELSKVIDIHWKLNQSSHAEFLAYSLVEISNSNALQQTVQLIEESIQGSKNFLFQKELNGEIIYLPKEEALEILKISEMVVSY